MMQQTICCFWTRTVPKTNTSTNEGEWKSTYVVNIATQPGVGLGLSLDTFDEKRCLVSDINPNGVIAKWNSTCRPSEKIKRGDCILGVNEHSGTAHEISAMLQKEKENQPHVMMLMKRGKVLNLNIRRNHQSESLGLGIDEPPEGVMGVKVKEVTQEGLIEQWNEANPFQVKPHDRVVSVNGLTSSVDIITLLKEQAALNIEVLTWVDDTKGKTWVDLTRGCL